MKKIAFLFIIILTLTMMVGCAPKSGSTSDVVVKVGGKDFTEQLILAQLAIKALEANGIKTEDKSNVAGSDTCRKALESGEFDMYWEYTGTAWLMLLANETVAQDAKTTFDKVKEADKANKLVWLDYAPMNDTYALVMKEEKGKELGITSYTELGAYVKANTGKLILACDHEFTARPDGLPGLVSTYGTDFGDSIKTMDMGIVFKTLADGQADVGMVFATDGRIKQYGLKVLKDDKSFFPIYNAAPCVREDTLAKVPQIADILKPISEKLTDEVMQDLNLKVDGEKMEPSEVAEQWLKDNGLIK